MLGCCANNSIGVTAVGADDTMNRVFIGLEKVNQEKLKELEKVLKEHNIPLDAAMVEEMVIKVDLLRTDYIRPLVGGIQIQNSNTGLKFTFGFVAVRESTGEVGIVTAGHGGNVSDKIYQPVTIPLSNYIGTVSIDPSSPRYSDSMWVPLASGVTYSYKIYNEETLQTTFRSLVKCHLPLRLSE